MCADTKNNPWKGLNFYVEGDVIFGRDSEILSLSHYIFNNTQTVVYGRSGIGKSSVLNAGIFPAARRMGMMPVTIRLKHDGIIGYIRQIRQALDENGIQLQELVPAVKSGSESLWEFMHRHRFILKDTGAEVVPLMVFDQFEEIFTLQSREALRREFFSELADLLNDVKPLYIVERGSNESADSARATKSIDTAAFKGLNLSLNLKKESGGHSKRQQGYVETPHYHMVFAMREDFLSSLEIYAHSIPVMKNNRFPLLPINEEQAAEIIMRPCPGLVDTDVARLIIEKVTGENDFKIDGIPEIQVDSAILSLYLSRLYDKMIAEGEDRITASLVEAYSANIMEDFYSEAIRNLPPTAVQWIENTLVNDDGRRDNRDRNMVLRDSGLTEEQLDRLIFNEKLLRQFSYGKSLRVELIHDVICPVIARRKQARFEELRVAEMEQKTKKEKRSLFIKTVTVAAVVVCAVIAASLWFVNNNMPVKIVDQRQNVVISVEEDATVNDMDFWRADLRIEGFYESGRDTLLYSRNISKSDLGEQITINTDSCMNIRFILDFGDFASIGKYDNLAVDMPMVSIMESPFVKLQVHRNLPNLVEYDGCVSLDAGALDIPLENAIVMIGDIVSVTDSVGHFSMKLEQMPDETTMLMIAKGSLGCFELPAGQQNDNDEDARRFRIEPADTLTGYYARAEAMDSVTKWNFSTVGQAYCANKGSQNGLYVKFSDGSEDRLKMYWLKGDTRNERVLLSGYFYFDAQKAELDKADAGALAYYIGNGYIDLKTIKDENDIPYRNFEFKGYDAAGNLRTITGKYYIVRGAGKYTGDVTSNKRQIATFGHAL
ncbi:MAG: ATP-binding protein [Muribaculaceae bacterium]|nr:ATP-binding protein [Muribaculaceae bacterium]